MRFAGELIIDTRRGLRLLETSHPPTYYLPIDELPTGLLRPAQGRSLCEFKGAARYWDLVLGSNHSARAGWSYDDPWSPYEALVGHVAFYAGRVEAAYVDEERVQPQPGDFYGGWVTSHVVGPFKGGPGTRGW